MKYSRPGSPALFTSFDINSSISPGSVSILHRYASICIDMHRYASICIDMHRYASMAGELEEFPGHEHHKHHEHHEQTCFISKWKVANITSLILNWRWTRERKVDGEMRVFMILKSCAAQVSRISFQLQPSDAICTYSRQKKHMSIDWSPVRKMPKGPY